MNKMTVKIVSTKDPITTDHPKTSAVFKSNPIALSQIKCLTPPNKWYQTAQSEQSNTSLPNQLVNIAFAKINIDGISPIEYKAPCHQGIEITRNPTERSKKLISTL